jgi:hypothetical protein
MDTIMNYFKKEYILPPLWVTNVSLSIFEISATGLEAFGCCCGIVAGETDLMGDANPDSFLLSGIF